MTDRPRTATALLVGARNGVTTGLPVTINGELEAWTGGAAAGVWIDVTIVVEAFVAGAIGTISVTVTVEMAASVTVTVTILPPWFACAELDAAAGDPAGGAFVGAAAAGWTGACRPAGTGAGLGLSEATCGSAVGFTRNGVAMAAETPAEAALEPDTWAAMNLPTEATGFEDRVMSIQDV